MFLQVNMATSKNFLKLQQEELDITEIINLVTFPNCGAISNFIGITRDSFENKKVNLLAEKLSGIYVNYYIISA